MPAITESTKEIIFFLLFNYNFAHYLFLTNTDRNLCCSFFDSCDLSFELILAIFCWMFVFYFLCTGDWF